MFIPLLTRSPKSRRRERRKGGGGGKSDSNGSGNKTGKSGGTPTKTPGTGSASTDSKPASETGDTSMGSKTPSGTNIPSAGKTTAVPLSTSTADGKNSAIAYGPGGGSAIVIPSGEMFAGRPAGGGLRSQVYGTRTYGSGYPGMTGRGVSGRGFPFWYWPVVWTGHHAPNGSYLQAPEYGNPYNDSRIGGPMAEATFISNSTNTTFYVVSDNSTVASLITSIDANCSSSLASSSSTSPQLYNASVPDVPQPEQAIQYYRASSIVLLLNGYNNSATLSSDPNAPDSPLPSGTDMILLDCLNQTIGVAAPLISSGSLRWSAVPSNASFLVLVWLVWLALS